MSDGELVPVSQDVADDWQAYETAKAARARWDAEEKRLKLKILGALGYTDDDDAPAPVQAVAPTGEPLFRVSIGRYRGMDFNHLRTNYPHIYAECETSKATKSLKA
ncbi:hypothetical protein [Streptomyces sp. NPDC048211]|uniref:hypothetical protein n=1 Tax=Streptomyces sp. NPDC048211 TaxID=3365516 RepID=UPI003720714B